MSSAADRIKANAERLRQQQASPKAPTSPATPTSAHLPSAAPQEPSPPATVENVVRQKNVRRTVDLSPSAHRGLDTWQRTTADRLGLARVTGQEVLTALVDELLRDAELAERITAAIATSRR
ncbi:hypothetical protein GCM10009701_64320 [Mycolicibacterium murale]